MLVPICFRWYAVALVLILTLEAPRMSAGETVVAGGGVALTLSERGEITRILHEGSGRAWRVSGTAGIAGCRDSGPVAPSGPGPGGRLEFSRRVADATGRACRILHVFQPDPGGVLWSVEVHGEGEAWSSPIEVALAWEDVASCRFWTAWADPEGERGWKDPLTPQPFRDLLFWYGQPSYEAMPYLGFHFDYHRIFSIPLATVMDDARDAAITVQQDLEDAILDLSLETGADGRIGFTHYHHRIQSGRRLLFRYRFAAHEADPRCALRAAVERNPAFFDPPLARAHDVVGTAAYSWYEGELDAARFHQMSFRVNWKASFDFPYMGMFLPPLPDDAQWTNFRRRPTSIRQMADYSRRMSELGFHVLNYFNITEFGNYLRFPLPPPKSSDDAELWKDAASFLQAKIADGILYASDQSSPFYSWVRCIAMDPGGRDYQAFLLEQAERHIERLPASDGICIDRTDWLRFYNPVRDDGASWAWDRPAASLFNSWKETMEQLGERMHAADKLIYINNAMARVDLMRHVDGMFDEFTFIGSHLNKCALMCVRKPLIGWIEPRQEEFRTRPDAFMQENLYMGCYPMAPFPGNDHSNLPDPEVERLFMDYGPLMDAMRGKKWVLAPHVVSVPGGEALANLFEVPGGFAIPVIHADRDQVRVVVRGLSKLVKADGFAVDALHPGARQPASVRIERQDDAMILDVPVVRGCAMVRLRQVWTEPDPTYFFTRQTVEIRTAIEGARLCLLPKEPESSRTTPYQAPITLTQSERLHILAQLGEKGVDVSHTAAFFKLPLPAPRILCASPVFRQAARVELECTATEAAIRFTLDGSEPGEGSPLYGEPITVEKSSVLAARAFLPGASPSATVSLGLFRVPPRPPRPEVFISDLSPATATTGWGGSVKTDASIEGRPLTLAGEVFAKGMGVSAVSELAYPMRSEYRRFVAVVGIDDEMKDYAEASATFQVWMDGRMLTETPVLRAGDVWHLDVELPPGGAMVRLIATDAGDGINCDHADWADAGFVK